MPHTGLGDSLAGAGACGNRLVGFDGAGVVDGADFSGEEKFVRDGLGENNVDVAAGVVAGAEWNSEDVEAGFACSVCGCVVLENSGGCSVAGIRLSDANGFDDAAAGVSFAGVKKLVG